MSRPEVVSPTRPATKRRANDLLRNYYGLGDAADTTAPSSSGNHLDPDSERFDAQAAFQSALTEQSLQQLLRSESDLLTEIRELDGERQSLVYNHHHELVSASETIGKMKTQADALSPSLLSLQSSLREISQTLQTIHVEPIEDQHSISIQSLIKKETENQPLSLAQMQKIIAPAVELPGRLRDIIVLEPKGTGLEKARGVWGSMEALLATWDEAGIPGAKDILNECRLVLREAQQQR